MLSIGSRFWIGAVLLIASAGVAGAVSVSPASPQPAGLKPGLGVVYYYAKINNVREIKGWEGTGGKAGPPLLQLNYNVGEGKVLTSGASDFVMAVINGYIKFDQAGTYTFLVNSNDGVRVWIGGTRIYDDPNVHADRLSDPLPVEVPAAGWYPIEVRYFEKKNTSTLEMFWQPPGAADFDFVPAEAFGN